LIVLATVPALAAAPSGAPVEGIHCDSAEGVAFHIHAHLSIFDHGKPVPIPSDVGRPLVAQCFYWLHTHTPDGIIHIESPTVRDFNLGNFFAVWGQPLSRTRAASASVPLGSALHIWVNGTPYGGPPKMIPLLVHTDIVIEAGPPYSKPEPFTAWGNL
jgi:hypothetical protein